MLMRYHLMLRNVRGILYILNIRSFEHHDPETLL